MVSVYRKPLLVLLGLIPRLVSGDRPMTKKNNSTALLNVSGCDAMSGLLTMQMAISFLIGTSDADYGNEKNKNHIEQVNTLFVHDPDKVSAFQSLKQNMEKPADHEDAPLRFLRHMAFEFEDLGDDNASLWDFSSADDPKRKLHQRKEKGPVLTESQVRSHQMHRKTNLNKLVPDSVAHKFFSDFDYEINTYRAVSLTQREELTDLVRMYKYIWPQARSMEQQSDPTKPYYSKPYAAKLKQNLDNILDLVRVPDFGAITYVIALDERVRLQQTVNEQTVNEQTLEYLKEQITIIDILVASGKFVEANNMFDAISEEVDISAACTSWYETHKYAFAMTTAWMLAYDFLK